MVGPLLHCCGYVGSFAWALCIYVVGLVWAMWTVEGGPMEALHCDADADLVTDDSTQTIPVPTEKIMIKVCPLGLHESSEGEGDECR